MRLSAQSVAVPLIASLSLLCTPSSAAAGKPRASTKSAKAVNLTETDRAAIAALPKAARRAVARGPAALRGKPRVRFGSRARKPRTRAPRKDPTGARQGPIGNLPPQMDITGWAPEHSGAPGEQLDILGYGLPINGLEVYLGNTKLSQQSSSSQKLVVTLPSSPTTGNLRVKRKSDGAWATLEPGYAVQTAPPPPVFTHFDADASGHNAVNAFLLVLLSWYAYDDVVGAAGDASGWEDAVDTLLEDQGLPKVDCFDATNALISTQGCVAANDEIVVVFLRGTQMNYQDWGTDLVAVPVPVSSWGSGVKVHNGFITALDEAWPTIQTKVATVRDNGQKVWLTGHSLGGALATLAAMRLEEDTSIPVEGVYTYGSPAVGNGAFKAAYEAHGINHQRYTQEHDIAPALPPSVATPVGFAHVGNLVEITDGGSVDPSSTNEPKLTADKRFNPYHNEYADDLRAAVTPASLQEQMPAVP